MSEGQAAPKKKLIEVAIPLDAINEASAREKSIRHGHPSTLHLWWARRPLAAARAVLFSQLVDDPSSRPEEFPTEAAQDAERERLFRLIEELVIWENSNNEDVLSRAKAEIAKGNGGTLPAVVDPFSGGGTIPLEAQRLGLEAHASDLNPVAVLIEKALIEIPPKFAGHLPVFPDAVEQRNDWGGASGLAEDVRKYGEWMRDEAFRKIGHLYPTVTDETGEERTVIAWIWARTVRSPNPANPVETPLVRSWWLSKKKGHEAYVVPRVVGDHIEYEVRHDAEGPRGEEDGTRNRRGGLALDGTPITSDYIKTEGASGGMGAHLIAVVADGGRRRTYLSPTERQEEIAQVVAPDDVPEQSLPYDPRNVWTPSYGLTKFSDLFTNRQLVALTTLSDLVEEARRRVLQDALAKGMPEGERLADGGNGAAAYADAVATYLGLAVSRLADRSSSLCSWDSSRESVRNVFARQAIPMVWDFAEPNLFSDSSGNFLGQVHWVSEVISRSPVSTSGGATQADASSRDYENVVVSTDPPYYDNIGYSDLSDFFYVWQRRSLRRVWPSLYGTVLTPKVEELVANPYRHDGKQGAETFFVEGFNQVFARIRAKANPDIPMTVYYAYKQQDTKGDATASTGWETLLGGLIQGGWAVTATWPMRSELKNRMIAGGTNALASSIVLACRPRPADAPSTSRRKFLAALKRELPDALRTLIHGPISPVDLVQATIGPGIAIFSRYARVREADGSDMSVREALSLINAELDEVLNEQANDYDPATRFAVNWYKTYGWGTDSSGMADQLARSAGTSLGALERGGILTARAGKAHLKRPVELAGEDWDPATDDSVSLWEATARLAGLLDAQGQGADAVARLLPVVGTRVNLDAVRELAFLLHHEAGELKNDSAEARQFNALAALWGDLNATAHKIADKEAKQGGRLQQASFDLEER